MFNLASNLESAAASFPGREAIVFDGRRWTYAEMEEQAGRVAHGLHRAGVRNGDHVALVCPNRPEFVASYFGILKAGAVVVCVSALLKAREIAYQLEHSDAVAMIAYGGDDMAIGRHAREAFEEVGACRRAWFIGMESFDELIGDADGNFESAAVSGEATAVILYTSGTTGSPRGAELSHANIIMNVMVLARVKPPLEEGGKTLIALPLFHVMAQTCAMHLAIYNAMTIVLVQRFRPAEVIRLMLEEGITGLHGVPTMYRAILDCQEVTEAEKTMLTEQLESFSAGGASLLPELQKECMETYSVSMSNGYGATETSPASCFHQTSGAIPLGSIGTAAWGVRLKIVDGAGGEVPSGEVGELLVRGHCVMKGYYKDPKATAEAIRDGWYHTGDLARMDEEGHVFIVGRKKELIIRGGFNVYPAEVEGVLLEHPAISQAAVVGVPDPMYGEEVKAFVTTRPGSPLDSAEVVSWARNELGAHKYPRLVELRETLPLGPTGKVLKRMLT
ncbi:MAG: long-chain fatty acid--CoA ligase [bacterium]|nr:long-chain fatty acid--CoA ligase [bacterium]